MQAEGIMNQAVITINENANIEEIAKILSDHNVSGAPVVDEDNRILGIVTEGDLLHKLTNPRVPGFLGLLGGIIYFNGVEQYREDFKKLAAIKAKEIMTTKVVAVNRQTELKELAAIMVEKNIKRLPVVENDRVVGIISRADIIKTMT